MNAVFTTTTGSTYRVEGDKIIREQATHEMRNDDGWSALLSSGELEVGKPFHMMIVLPGKDFQTYRVTSPVTHIKSL